MKGLIIVFHSFSTPSLQARRGSKNWVVLLVVYKQGQKFKVKENEPNIRSRRTKSGDETQRGRICQQNMSLANIKGFLYCPYFPCFQTLLLYFSYIKLCPAKDLIASNFWEYFLFFCLFVCFFKRQKKSTKVKPQAANGVVGSREVHRLCDCRGALEKGAPSRYVWHVTSVAPCHDYFIFPGWMQSCGIFLICFHFLISSCAPTRSQRVSTCQSRHGNIGLGEGLGSYAVMHCHVPQIYGGACRSLEWHRWPGCTAEILTRQGNGETAGDLMTWGQVMWNPWNAKGAGLTLHYCPRLEWMIISKIMANFNKAIKCVFALNMTKIWVNFLNFFF